MLVGRDNWVGRLKEILKSCSCSATVSCLQLWSDAEKEEENDEKGDVRQAHHLRLLHRLGSFFRDLHGGL